MANSYLTPDWLMSDIGALLENPMSQEDFTSSDLSTHRSQPNRYYQDEEGNRVTTDAKGNPIGAGGRGWYYDMSGHFGDSEGTLRYGKIPGLTSRADWEHSTEYGGETYAGAEGDTSGQQAAYEAYKQDIPTAQSSMWDSEQFAEGVGLAKGKETPPGKTFTQFTPEMFKKLRTEYYQPQIEEGRGSLLSQLTERGRLASAKGGALAGYGGREKASQIGQQQYYGGMEDIYAGIEREKAQGLQSIYDVLGQYETIGQDLG